MEANFKNHIQSCLHIFGRFTEIHLKIQLVKNFGMRDRPKVKKNKKLKSEQTKSDI